MRVASSETWAGERLSQRLREQGHNVMDCSAKDVLTKWKNDVALNAVSREGFILNFKCNILGCNLAVIL
jgi:hypothetical protein